MELRRLAAERRDADRVLEQAARVRVVVVRRCRIRGELAVGEHGAHRRREARVRQLAGEELEEALQLLGVAPRGRRQARGVDVGRGLERAHVELEPVAEPLDAAEHAHRVALARSARRAARRRSRPAPRSGRTGRRARARGTARRPSSAASASSSPRRRPRRRGPPRGRRSPARVYGRVRPCPASRRFARSGTTRRSPGRSRPDRAAVRRDRRRGPCRVPRRAARTTSST